LDEYDQLGDASFSSAHDFTLRQRKLETWATKARDAIAELVHATAAKDREVAGSTATSSLGRTGS